MICSKSMFSSAAIVAWNPSTSPKVAFSIKDQALFWLKMQLLSRASKLNKLYFRDLLAGSSFWNEASLAGINAVLYKVNMFASVSCTPPRNTLRGLRVGCRMSRRIVCVLRRHGLSTTLVSRVYLSSVPALAEGGILTLENAFFDSAHFFTQPCVIPCLLSLPFVLCFADLSIGSRWIF